MKSIWEIETSIEERPPLHGRIETDVAVIGAGIAGILAAYFLERRGFKTVVLEANRIGGGQTGGTTAKITSQHHLIYNELIDKVGVEQARLYAAAHQDAIGEYARLVKEDRIACDFEETSAFIYSRQDTKRIEDEIAAANKIGIHAKFVEHTNLPFPIRGAIQFDRQAQFNPLAFLKEIAKTLTVYEKTRVLSIDDQTVLTNCGSVKAKHIVMAAHFPFINVPGFYFARMYQQRSYVIALENAAELDGMYIDADTNGFSFRNYKNYLLLGGGGHRCGENSSGGKYAKLRAAAKKFFPDSLETTSWSAQDCMTLDGIPYIGQYCLTSPNLYVATGFQKWGMTTSMVAAKLLSDRIAGDKNPYAEVFSPQRFHLSASAKEMLTNGYQAVKALGREFLTLPSTLLEDLPKNHGGIVEYEGEKYGVYKNSDGEAFIVSSRCPHLGCQLEWNPDERSWDCPCHGSRFDYIGKLLTGPALQDICLK